MEDFMGIFVLRRVFLEYAKRVHLDKEPAEPTYHKKIDSLIAGIFSSKEQASSVCRAMMKAAARNYGFAHETKAGKWHHYDLQF